MTIGFATIERIAQGTRTKRVPGSCLGEYVLFLPSFTLNATTDLKHSKKTDSFVYRRSGKDFISPSSHTQDMKMGSCGFQCNVRPVSVYCDGVGCLIVLCMYIVTGWGV